MVNETIQYYIEKGGTRIYLLLLDATKAFDKASYKVLFDILLKKNVCAKLVNLLYYHSIVFNPSKTKLLYFNLDPLSEIPPIYLNGVQISMVEHEKHLGNYVSTNIILGSFHVRSPKKNEI